MPACKNVKSKTFTGKENTPLGRGYHASGEKVNTVMKGKDGKKYKVVKTKTSKRWQKVNGRMKSPGRSARGAGMSTGLDLSYLGFENPLSRRLLENGLSEDFIATIKAEDIEVRLKEQSTENIIGLKEGGFSESSILEGIPDILNELSNEENVKNAIVLRRAGFSEDIIMEYFEKLRGFNEDASRQVQNGIENAILLKEADFPEDFIMKNFYWFRDNPDHQVKNLMELKEAGFSEDFIKEDNFLWKEDVVCSSAILLKQSGFSKSFIEKFIKIIKKKYGFGPEVSASSQDIIRLTYTVIELKDIDVQEEGIVFALNKMDYEKIREYISLVKDQQFLNML